MHMPPDKFQENGAEEEALGQTRRINSRHSQTYTNDPDRQRDDANPADPHQP
jgi:hypothetical protein